MIEELKPCPEMIEKVARAIEPEAFDALGGQLSAAAGAKARAKARAAITAYDPDKRLSQEVDELKHDLERQMTIANIECNEAERLREVLEEAALDLENCAHRFAISGDPGGAELARNDAKAARAALSHNGG